MATLSKKAKLRDGFSPKETIQSPSGRLEDQITGQDLLDNPEKYINIYPSYYANAQELKHEVNTRYKRGVSVGRNCRLNESQAENGVTYAFIAPVSNTATRQSDKAKAMDIQKRILARAAKAKAEAEKAAQNKPKTRSRATKK